MSFSCSCRARWIGSKFDDEVFLFTQHPILDTDVALMRRVETSDTSSDLQSTRILNSSVKVVHASDDDTASTRLQSNDVVLSSTQILNSSVKAVMQTMMAD
jgi:hypothetical protein